LEPYLSFPFIFVTQQNYFMDANPNIGKKAKKKKKKEKTHSFHVKTF
jgi:hypothetical protein